MSDSEKLDAERVDVDVIDESAPSAVHMQVKVVLSPEANLAICATMHTANEIGVVATEMHL